MGKKAERRKEQRVNSTKIKMIIQLATKLSILYIIHLATKLYIRYIATVIVFINKILKIMN